MTKAIIGLGNPGSRYENTKHNIGFMVVDEIAREFNVTMKKNIFEAEVGDFFYEGQKVMLIKPLTFMNESGRAVGPLMTYYGLDIADIVVICDDLDMPQGKVRLRQKGSAGGHNGLKSLISHLRSENFFRIKVGIGRPQGKMTVVNHVLHKFSADDLAVILPALAKARHAALYFAGGHDFAATQTFAAKE
ncbi:aminoacyl-tRNA hydrolase [Enterococcus nangangensis]|uniref:aminoacyl-tRNA hydrolase n=1 Tax=Enterococcus nangangensis TaxID=2559926 RepID=UPI0010F5474D|nr:aminoacyl-tRNA hydrolase [Enterococcus nangangensis]